MSFSRRTFLAASTSAGIGFAAHKFHLGDRPLGSSNICEQGFQPPAFSITPVVSDGKWIWTDPPGETGLLEPREFEVSVGMRFSGNGTNLSGSTVAPVSHPEQQILDYRIETDNCNAQVVAIDEGAAQLQLFAGVLRNGQAATANAVFKMQICKSHFGFGKEQFPKEQPHARQFPKRFRRNSPGINSNATVVKDLVRAKHPLTNK